MNDILEIQKKIVPEVIEIIEKRYKILKNISLNNFIGRRLLSQRTNLPERLIRTEVDFLKNTGFIDFSKAGMTITDKGKKILEEFEVILFEISGNFELRDKVCKSLGIKEVIIINDSVDDNESAIVELSKEACKYFLKTVSNKDIVGITGGYTMSEFANQMPRKVFTDMMIVPARGGLGDILQIQSNAIVANLAEKLSADYKLLQIPDNIPKDILESIYDDKNIKSTYEYIQKLDYLIFGIGNAKEMAERRNTDKKIWRKINDAGAVAESFGYYFDINGKIVFETSTVGIKLEQYSKMTNILAIAGGEKKAEAILAISQINKNLVLITDKGASKAILKKLNK